ncbi:MAG: iron-containing alcohol dehydrogenase [Verrucomicrobia bacterium]|nr:iron-containing alcohol dehydrogenase [Verrucomicrobiota bacterium]MBT7065038.1 iron-containing alcohol dehydrogenase [Verrucomicrobiota bacterium]MBT7701636.1 iron-containing alcohol dehydrogenase [Verrucomicrobiota bacterium]
MNVLPASLLFPMQTLSGKGKVTGLLPECAAFGSRGLLVHGRSLAASGVLERILAANPSGLETIPWQHPGGEPTVEQVDALRDVLLSGDVAWVAAVGGGSVMDVAKAAAGLRDAPLPTSAYHDGEPLPSSRVAFVAAPATAGTGSEATMVSVLTNSATGTKKSIRHPSHTARLVILDPDLLTSCPPALVAASGMDAFTQAVESYLSRNATRLTDHLALQAVEDINQSIETVFNGGDDASREALLRGSYLAGLALSNARLGLVHGLAHPLGARFHLPHGLVCAVCLPHVLRYNRDVCRAKYARLADVLGPDVEERVAGLIRSMAVANPFADEVLQDEEEVVAETVASGSTGANPRDVDAAAVRAILHALFSATGSTGA